MSNMVKYNDEQLDLLKSTICKGLDDGEINLFAHVCKQTSLNPFMRQIYPVKRYDTNLEKDCMTIQTGIDGFRLIAERTGNYAPGREPTFIYNEHRKLESATAYIKKLTKDGTWHEVSATAFFDEYAQRKKDKSLTTFWVKMGHNQLAKCAEALALRRAFPAEMSGIYTREEMQQAETAPDAELAQQAQTLEVQEKIELNLPPEIDPNLAEEYIKASAKASKKFTEMDLKRRAAENITGFVDSFNVWMEKSKKSEAKVLEDAQI